MRAPTQIPPVWLMLEDIPFSNKDIAKHLGVSLRSLNRYRDTGHAPKSVLLALFWETKWGRSLADADSANDAKYAKDLAYALQCALDRSRAQVLALENELSNAFSYAANSPIFKIA